MGDKKNQGRKECRAFWSLSGLFLFIFIALPAQSRLVRIEWDLDQSMLAYEIQVARDIGFKNIIVEERVDVPFISVDLGSGTFFYRVRFIDKDDDPLYWSEPQKVSVLPRPPDLLAPANQVNFDYYEILPQIELKWTEVEKGVKYHLFVYDSQGEKVFDQLVNKPQHTFKNLTTGLYYWKVKVIHDRVYRSEFTEIWSFSVQQKTLAYPTLRYPLGSDEIPASDSLTFAWEKDPNAFYSDFYLTHKGGEKIFGKSKSIAKKNIKKNQITFPKGLGPGEYSWSVGVKQLKKSKGVKSFDESFIVYSLLERKGSYRLEYGLGYHQFDTTITTNRTGSDEKYSKADAKMLHDIQGSYLFTDGFGLELGIITGYPSFNVYDYPYQDYQFKMNLRAGATGVSVYLFLGLKQTTAWEIITDSEGKYHRLTPYGPFAGLLVKFPVGIAGMMEFGGNYFSPQRFLEGGGELTGDIGGGHLGYRWNMKDRWWLGFYYRYSRTALQFVPDSNTDTKSNWVTEHSTPFLISISTNH